jgi:DNA-binding NtrC family response regulator
MILLLAPDAPERSELAAILETLGHDVTVRGPGQPAQAVNIAARSDAVVLDLAVGQDAIRFLRRHTQDTRRSPVVCIADRRRPAASSEALRLGAVDIVARPPTAESLAAALGNAREFSQLQTDTSTTPAPADVVPGGVFGPSPVMRSVLALARRVGPSRCAVLIVGERGTGRELVARIIHGTGADGRAPFHKLASSAVSATELRETVESAGPQATIYLEDLSELPMPLQIKVEEYLSANAAGGQGSLRRAVAANAPRFVAGAQPRLWSLVDRGAVRRELVDALSVVRIDLPPLRQRPEDIPLLAMHFLKEASRQNGVPEKTFTRSAITLLSALPWPGNAIEVRSLCERLAVLVPRGVVLLEDVVANVRFDGAEAVGRSQETLKTARERFERDHIAAALQHHKGRMGSAARELGIERTNLYRKIKQLGIRWEGELE